MKLKLVVVLAVASCCHGDLALAADASPARAVVRPNILFILADDLGWSDTTLYHHTKFYETPQIERLAKRGMTFTWAYSANPLCSPTRASILTGLYPARIGITAPLCHEPTVVLKKSLLARGDPRNKAISARPSRDWRRVTPPWLRY